MKWIYSTSKENVIFHAQKHNASEDNGMHCRQTPNQHIFIYTFDLFAEFGRCWSRQIMFMRLWCRARHEIRTFFDSHFQTSKAMTKRTSSQLWKIVTKLNYIEFIIYSWFTVLDLIISCLDAERGFWFSCSYRSFCLII